MTNKYSKWIFVRDGIVQKVFNDRKEAVKYFKELLEQTLKDFKTQDKTDEFTYEIIIPKIEIKQIEERESYLGL